MLNNFKSVEYKCFSNRMLSTCLYISIAYVFWIFVYKFIGRFIKNGFKETCLNEAKCRLVTMMHASFIFTLSSYSIFIQGPWPLSHLAGANTDLHQFICVFSLGYFMFDLCWCLYYKTEGYLIIFHHCLGIFGNILIIWRQTNGVEMMVTLFGTEISNPILQIRWFMLHFERPIIMPIINSRNCIKDPLEFNYLKNNITEFQRNTNCTSYEEMKSNKNYKPDDILENKTEANLVNNNFLSNENQNETDVNAKISEMINLPYVKYIKYIDALFFTLFTFMRIFCATFFLFIYIVSPMPDLFIKLAGVTIYAVGILLWFGCCRYLFDRYWLRISKKL